MAALHLLPHLACSKFAARTFGEYILKQLELAEIVWDLCRKDSLKSARREKRGSGTRQKVFPTTRIPPNWQSFLHVDDSKTKIFSLLAQQAVTLPTEERKELYSTCGGRVLTSANRSDSGPLEPCNHKEADTPLLVDVLNACSFGHRWILIKTNDADVVVLAMSVAENPPADGIWISYGTGKHLRHLAAHEIAKKTGQQISKGLTVVPWHYWLG